MTPAPSTRGPALRANLLAGVLGCWRTLRRVVGDDAYERYLVHHAARHAGAPALDRRAYYLERQRRKWDGVQRCC